MDELVDIPIFAVKTVLFPGGALPLRVFEPRYMDMVSRCLQAESPLGICLIREGEETGDAPDIHEIGTLGEISYWQALENGLLGITVRGVRRFRIHETHVRPDQLTMAKVELYPMENSCPVTEQHHKIQGLVRQAMENRGHPFTTLPKYFDDGVWIANRMIEMMPIPLEHKQHLLLIDDPPERLERLVAMFEGRE